MAKLHPLGLRIEIAELFDSGVFTGTTPLDAIVAQSRAASLQSARHGIRLLGFTKVKSRNRIMQPIPARWEPPRKLPELTGRHSPVAHAVRELCDSGRRTGRCYAADLAPLVDASGKAVSKALMFFRPHQGLNGRCPAEAAGGEIPFGLWRDAAEAVAVNP